MGENQNMTLGLPGSTVYLGPRCQHPGRPVLYSVASGTVGCPRREAPVGRVSREEASPGSGARPPEPLPYPTGPLSPPTPMQLMTNTQHSPHSPLPLGLCTY